MRRARGEAPAFVVPPFQVGALWETPFALGLGVACGFIAVLFIGILGALERGFARLRIPEPLKPAAGGLAIGLLILVSPGLYGVGYETMDATLRGELPWRTLLLLLLVKPLATSITLWCSAWAPASGTSGMPCGWCGEWSCARFRFRRRRGATRCARSISAAASESR